MENTEFRSQNPKSVHTNAELPDLMPNTPVRILKAHPVTKVQTWFNGIFSHWDKDNDAHIFVPDLGKKVFTKKVKNLEVLTDKTIEEVFHKDALPIEAKHRSTRAEVITEIPESKRLAPVKEFDINQRFSFLASLVKMVIRGQVNSAIITGDGGLGKTKTVLDQLAIAGMVDKQDFISVKGYSTARGLYNTLYYNSDKLIIFDDCDEVLRNDVAKNILKGALDTNDKRIVNWMAQMPEGSEVPDEFEFTGRVIFISNMKVDQVPQALVSRANSVDVSMTTAEKLYRMRTVLPRIMPEVDMELKEEAFSVMEKWAEHTRDLNFRTLMKIIAIREASEADKDMKAEWVEMAEYMLLS
jgi:hypothetical protein